MKTKYIVIIVVAVILVVVLSILVVRFIRKRAQKKLLKDIDKLEIKKNHLASMPVMIQLSKIEDIAKSEQLEEKVNELKVRYEEIKKVRLTKVNDMIVDLDVLVEKRSYREYVDQYSDVEMELDKVESSINSILTEIDEIASYEEKYRNIVIQLKSKYRFLEHTYTDKITMFSGFEETIKMQFENIAKRFNDFDKVMEEKLYNEVVLVVRSIDNMIDNLDVVIKELPDILLLLNDLIPGRIKDLNTEYQKMIEEGYTLGFLNYEENIKNIEVKEEDIITRAKVLNITNSLFDARTILEYLDNLFRELEKEREARNNFEKLDEVFKSKTKKMDHIVKSIYDELDDIKAMYHLNESDLEIIDKLNLKLSLIIKDHKKLKREIKNGQESYLKHSISLNELITRMNNVSVEFDNALRTLGSFYEDEKRSREQLKEMQDLLKKCKSKIRNYRLPIIYDNYFIEEEEASDAIGEVEKELNNKPIIIKDLNMRVETARDLTFKLNATIDEMIKYAYFSEILIVYGNKYREKKEVDNGISKAELLYFKGNYKECFDLLLKIIKSVDSELSSKINKFLKSI